MCVSLHFKKWATIKIRLAYFSLLSIVQCIKDIRTCWYLQELASLALARAAVWGTGPDVSWAEWVFGLWVEQTRGFVAPVKRSETGVFLASVPQAASATRELHALYRTLETPGDHTGATRPGDATPKHATRMFPPLPWMTLESFDVGGSRWDFLVSNILSKIGSRKKKKH